MTKRPLPPNTKLNSERATKVFEGKRFSIYQWEQKQFDSSIETYEIVKRPDSVVILAVMDNGDIVCLNEQQSHWDKPALTLPAGGVHDDEDLKEAARRELEEETGLIFKNYHLVHVLDVPGIEWFAYTYIATGYVDSKEKKLDPGEKTDVITMSKEKFISLVRSKSLRYPVRFIEDLIIADKLHTFDDIVRNPEKYEIK